MIADRDRAGHFRARAPAHRRGAQRRRQQSISTPSGIEADEVVDLTRPSAPASTGPRPVGERARRRSAMPFGAGSSPGCVSQDPVAAVAGVSGASEQAGAGKRQRAGADAADHAAAFPTIEQRNSSGSATARCDGRAGSGCRPRSCPRPMMADGHQGPMLCAEHRSDARSGIQSESRDHRCLQPACHLRRWSADMAFWRPNQFDSRWRR